jgi:hypothetical protein
MTNKNSHIYLFISLTLPLLGLSIYNIITNLDFFELGISDIVNISITIFIATYLFKLQSRNNRRRNHCIELIDKLIIHLDTYVFSDCNSDNLINDKKISQYVSLIETYAKDFNINKEIITLKNYADSYRNELSKVVDHTTELDQENLFIKNLNSNTINTLENLKIKILS